MESYTTNVAVIVGTQSQIVDALNLMGENIRAAAPEDPTERADFALNFDTTGMTIPGDVYRALQENLQYHTTQALDPKTDVQTILQKNRVEVAYEGDLYQISMDFQTKGKSIEEPLKAFCAALPASDYGVGAAWQTKDETGYQVMLGNKKDGGAVVGGPENDCSLVDDPTTVEKNDYVVWTNDLAEKADAVGEKQAKCNNWIGEAVAQFPSYEYVKEDTIK